MWMDLVQICPSLNGLLAPQSGSESLMLILERLMVVEMCTSAPDVSRRADKTSNVQLPFLCASNKSAPLILLSKALLVVNRLFQKQHSETSRNTGASGLFSSVGYCVFVLLFTPNNIYRKHTCWMWALV